MIDRQFYKAGMEVLPGAIQQFLLVPLDEMEDFFIKAIENNDLNTELNQTKLQAAKHQLLIIRTSKQFRDQYMSIIDEPISEWELLKFGANVKISLVEEHQYDKPDD